MALDSTVDPCPVHGEGCPQWRDVGVAAYNDEVRELETHETAREGYGS